MLSFKTLRFLLIGQGKKLHERKNKLKELGAENLTVLIPPLPNILFPEFDVVMVVDLDDDTSAKIHADAKAAKCLVNVEDKKEFCDFFFQSFVNRGDLLISVSTKGKSPGTAKLIRDRIEELFPETWAARLDEIAKLREEWKNSGLSYDEVNQKTQEYIRKNKWLA